MSLRGYVNFPITEEQVSRVLSNKYLHYGSTKSQEVFQNKNTFGSADTDMRQFVHKCPVKSQFYTTFRLVFELIIY